MKRNVFALFGAVAVLFSAVVVVTLTRATLSAGGDGDLKCYDKSGTRNAC